MKVYHRNATIFAGIFTTIQGVLWAFIAVYSIGVYGCNFDFPFYNDSKNTVGNLLYYAYFIGSCRFSQFGEVPPPLLHLDHPHRTYILMIIYGILSAVWIPSSILILVIAVNKIHGKRGSRCYWPWIITTGMFLLLDIATTIIYSVDIANSMTTKDYANHFSYIYSLTGMDGLTVLPAVMMTLLSCRIVLIYIVNLVLFGVVIQASRALRRLSPAAAFVESDARMTPNKGYGGQTSSWVRIGRKPAGPKEVTPVMRSEDVDLGRIQDRQPIQFQTVPDRRPDPPTQLPLDPARRPPRPTLKPLPISSPVEPPPPPPDINSPSPFYDVFGKPTTPDSPQPVFIRTRNITQPISEGVNKNIPWSYMNPQQQFSKHIPEPDYTIRIKRSSPTNSSQSEEGEVYTSTRKFENNPSMWKVM